MRNPVARSPLLGKGGAHGKTTRREAARGQRRAGQADARDPDVLDVRRMTRWPHHPDTLSRGDLETNRMREIYAEVATRRALTDEELSASLTATLATKPKGAGWWVFAYGSLLWNPLFPVAEMRPATLTGLLGVSACGRWPRAEHANSRASCSGSSAAARAAASRCGCRRCWRSTSSISCGGVRWSSARIGHAGSRSTPTGARSSR